MKKLMRATFIVTAFYIPVEAIQLMPPVNVEPNTKTSSGASGAIAAPSKFNNSNNQTLPLQSTSDLQLNTRVQDELRASIRNFSNDNYSAYSQNGVVTLRGTVSSQAEADQMIQAAGRVSGVSRVNNSLIVETSDQQQ